MSASEAQDKLYGQVVAKAWQDEAFKQRLLAEPRVVLKEQGIELSAEIEVRMVENTDRVVYLTLPARPSEDELSAEELEQVAAGHKPPRPPWDDDPIDMTVPPGWQDR